MKNEAQKLKRRHKLINLIGVLVLLVAGLLIGLLFFIHSPPLQQGYEAYQRRMVELENYVLDLREVWLILLAVLLLYALKSVVPFFPIPMMCFISGAVLPMYMSFAVNITGLMVLVSLKYLWGRRLGGGQVKRLLDLNKDARIFLEQDRKSKPWLLFVFRTVPSFPVNAISQLYGAMGFDYADFVLISLLGFLPRLIAYTIMGKNVFRPLSVPFLIPLIIIFTLSGISIIGINLVLSKRQKEA
jgi:uncharacterized membrane protein YdjX (TVP38/TMEM64 family)